MTLPWFLNPWAEVRRLRCAMRDERLRSSADRAEMHRTVQFYRNENADLRRRIAEMEERRVAVPVPFKIPAYEEFMRDCQEAYRDKQNIDFSSLKNRSTQP